MTATPRRNGLDEFLPDGPIDDKPPRYLPFALNALDSPEGRAAVVTLEANLYALGVPGKALRDVTEYVLSWAWHTFDAGERR
jgi:hypothetical protein